MNAAINQKPSLFETDHSQALAGERLPGCHRHPGCLETGNLLSSLDPTIFMQQVVNGFQLGFVYALIALGYTMVYGIVRLINFAHGDVFMVGAFVSYYAIARFGLNTWPSKVLPGLPVWLSSAIGVITVILLSMVSLRFPGVYHRAHRL